MFRAWHPSNILLLHMKHEICIPNCPPVFASTLHITTPVFFKAVPDKMQCCGETLELGLWIYTQTRSKTSAKTKHFDSYSFLINNISKLTHKFTPVSYNILIIFSMREKVLSFPPYWLFISYISRDMR